MQVLGFLTDDTFSLAYEVSEDGSVVVGYSQEVLVNEAFQWTSGGGMQGIGDLAGGGTDSLAFGISADGSTLVGQGNGTAVEAFRWTSSGGIEGLGDLVGGDFHSRANVASGDGSTIVGYGNDTTCFQAMVYRDATGTERLADILVARGDDIQAGND